MLAALAVGVFTAPLHSTILAQENSSNMQSTETTFTQMIAIGRITTNDPSLLRPQMAQEVQDTVKLYLKGGIAAWYTRKDEPGVVFILNAATEQEANEMLAPLPFVEQGWLAFDYIPIGPLEPLAQLLQAPAQ